MDAREALARAMFRAEGDIYSAGFWEEAGEDIEAAYVQGAGEIIQRLEKVGWILARKPVATNPGVPQEVE